MLLVLRGLRSPVPSAPPAASASHTLGPGVCGVGENVERHNEINNCCHKKKIQPNNMTMF